MFGKKDKEEKLYQDGYSDCEKKLLQAYNIEKQDMINEHEERIEEKNFEIMRLNLKLKNWQSAVDQANKDQIDMKKRESKLKQKEYKIDNFIDELTKELQNKLNADAEKVKDIFLILRDYDSGKIEIK